MKRERKFKHRCRPYWRLCRYHNTTYWQSPHTSVYALYGLAFAQYMEALEHLGKDYREVELQRVQPLHPFEPGWCAHNNEYVEVIARRRIGQ